MRIGSVRHRRLRRLLEANDARGLRADMVPRIRNVLSALVSAVDIDGVRGPPGWRIHCLVGDRAGVWSISVSGNWRITFELEGDEIRNLDLEDYH